MAGFISLIEENGRHIEGNNNFEQQNKTWTGMDMVAVLQMTGAGPEVFGELKASVTLFCTGCEYRMSKLQCFRSLETPVLPFFSHTETFCNDI